MEGKRFIHKIKLTNFLSFGPEGMELELQPLNVLIGPNASGKSNFIEAFAVLKAAPSDLRIPFREGGGVEQWLYRGGENLPTAELQTSVRAGRSRMAGPEAYELHFTVHPEQRHRVWVVHERVDRGDDSAAYLLYGGTGYGSWDPGRPSPKRQTLTVDGRPWVGRPLGRMPTDQSVLSQLRDAEVHPEITRLGSWFREIGLYRECSLGRGAQARHPQPADLPADRLLDSGQNLALVLNDLEHRAGAKDRVLECLRNVDPQVRDYSVRVIGGTVQLYLEESGLPAPVPATRLSDGTLRYLLLLAMLLHPEPPPVTCIEEPELGLHPDAIRTIGELLIEASQRTQLIVTTHSDFLVAALSEVPEAVVVCERDTGGTRMQRLEPERLTEWLKQYSLGDLWVRGHLGGNR